MGKQIIRRPSGAKPPVIDTQDLTNSKQIQNFNNAAIYTKGFNANLTAGTPNEIPIVLGGKCRRMFGINLFVPNANINDNDVISLSVNSELIIDKVNWKTYSANSANNSFKTEQYFALPRGLSGSDSVLLTITPISAHAIWITFYLANK